MSIFVRKQHAKFPASTLLLASMLISVHTNAQFSDDPAEADITFPNQRSEVRGDESLVEFFDWQDSWGSIHMNTDADGMLDPGMPSTSGLDKRGSSHAGRFACRPGANVCDKGREVDIGDRVNLVDKISQNYIGHGIKYDIKNSVLNCMSKVVPNSPIFRINGDANPFAANTCTGYGLQKRLPRSEYPFTLSYAPLWREKGTSDDCQQQVINNCIQDVFSCNSRDDKLGSNKPVEHVFTKEDVKSLCGSPDGCRMPDVYYRFRQKDKWHVTTNANLRQEVVAAANAQANVSGSSDDDDDDSSGSGVTQDEADALVAALPEGITTDPITSWEAIQNRSSDLARIRAFEVKLDSEFSGDVSKFYVVDPSDFFDLRDYIDGGRYDSNYSKVTPEGLPKTPDTCPVLGLGATGYGGICDPSGNAGCNLPIYGVGAVTDFTDRDGQVSTFEHFPLKWSGYVKEWKVITKEQYLANVEGRVAEQGGQLYVDGSFLNDNPILMLHRANEYCERRERYSGRVDMTKAPDLPCIQYKQYQRFDREEEDEAPLFTFVDLFVPDVDIGLTNTHSIAKLFTHDRVNGKAVGEARTSATDGLQLASFLDPQMPVMNTDNPFASESTRNAIVRMDYNEPSNRVYSQQVASWEGLMDMGALPGSVNPGLTIGIADATKNRGNPMAFNVEPGTKVCFRLPADNRNEESPEYQPGHLFDGKLSTRCACVTHGPGENLSEQKDLFIPTNTQAELASFANAQNAGKIGNLQIETCQPQFLTYEQHVKGINVSADEMARIQEDEARNPANYINPNGSRTWIGKLSCDALAVKPACNETKLITAQRTCILGDGIQGSCSDCANVPAEEGVDFSPAAVGGGGMAEIIDSPLTGNSCYFRAACFSVNSAGCPAAGASGGHIFCVTADTKIRMADGSEKEIAKIRAGEKVLAFNMLNNKEELFPSEVESLAVTRNQSIIKLTLGSGSKRQVLKITPQHKVMLSAGIAVPANDLMVGDEVLNGNGDIVEVSKKEFDDEKVTVYNLVLEDDTDGYVASGVRVLSYPSKE